MDNDGFKLRKLTQAIAKTDISSLLELVVSEFIQHAKVDIACFYIPTASGQTLTAAAVYPKDLWFQSAELTAGFLTRDRDTGGIGKASRERQVLLITDTAAAEARGDYIPFSANVTSEIIAPVFDGDSLVAVLVGSRHSGDLLSEGEKTIAEFLTDLLSLAYRIQRERATREAELEFLRNITQIDTGTSDVLFARFLESVGAFLPSKFISLWLYNNIDETLVMRGFYPPVIGRQRISFEQIESTVLALDDCLSSAAVREQRPQVFENIQLDPRNANTGFARRHELDWFISFPVLDEDRGVMAVLNVYPHVDPPDISESEIEATSLLVLQLAPRLRLHSMKRREAMLAIYSRICRRIQRRLHNRQAWDALAAQIAIDMKCEASSIFIFDSGTGSLVLRGSTGIEGDPNYDDVTYKVGEGLTGSAFKRQAPVVYYRDLAEKYSTSHISKFRERLRSSDKSRSILLQAIVRENGDAVGVIRCNNKNLSPRDNCGRFSDEDIAVLAMIGLVLSERLSP